MTKMGSILAPTTTSCANEYLCLRFTKGYTHKLAFLNVRLLILSPTEIVSELYQVPFAQLMSGISKAYCTPQHTTIYDTFKKRSLRREMLEIPPTEGSDAPGLSTNQWVPNLHHDTAVQQLQTEKETLRIAMEEALTVCGCNSWVQRFILGM